MLDNKLFSCVEHFSNWKDKGELVGVGIITACHSQSQPAAQVDKQRQAWLTLDGMMSMKIVDRFDFMVL